MNTLLTIFGSGLCPLFGGENLGEVIVFCVLALFIIVFSVMTVTTTRLVRAATYLLFVLFATAGLYFLLGYTFPCFSTGHGVCRWHVVLYVFAVLLTSGEGDRVAKLKRSKFFAGLGTAIVGGAIVLFITLKHRFVTVATDMTPVEGDIHSLGHQLLSSDKFGYLLPFEAVSVLLLACIIGGVLIARKR